MVFNKQTWGRLGGFQPWVCSADTEFIRRARSAGVGFRIIPRHLYLRRVHRNSLTQSQFTGYRSQLRAYYNDQIAQAQARYAAGAIAERLVPITAKWLPF